jgi:FkbM family methyltransferase
VSDETLVSYAQNGEDVVLWRALGHVTHGRYVDVGSWDPDVDSVTKLFYDRGWRGVNVEPVPEFADKLSRHRPFDEVVQVAITDRDTDQAVLHRFGATGLATIDDDIAERHEGAGLERSELHVPAARLDDVLAASQLVAEAIHFLKIDAPGAEEQAVRSVDLVRWRPWVLVIESTEPRSTVTSVEDWEPLVLEAGYTFTLFDGLSRYYVSEDHPEIVERLSFPACPLDDFVTVRQQEQDVRIAQLTDEVAGCRDDVIRWRGQAVTYWSNAMAFAQVSEDAAERARAKTNRVRRQLLKVRETLLQVRNDRRRLRADVTRLKQKIEQLQRAEPAAAASSGTRWRAAVKKVMGA